MRAIPYLTLGLSAVALVATARTFAPTSSTPEEFWQPPFEMTYRLTAAYVAETDNGDFRLAEGERVVRLRYVSIHHWDQEILADSLRGAAGSYSILRAGTLISGSRGLPQAFYTGPYIPSLMSERLTREYVTEPGWTPLGDGLVGKMRHYTWNCPDRLDIECFYAEGPTVRGEVEVVRTEGGTPVLLIERVDGRVIQQIEALSLVVLDDIESGSKQW